MTHINQEKDKKYLLVAFIAEGIAALLIAITLFIFFIIGLKIERDNYKINNQYYDCATPYYNNNYDSIQFY